MKQDLGFDPLPADDSSWEQFYETSKWFKENAKDDVPYGHGHQAKQHDSLMNDFSNVLWAYGGDYFKDGGTVGRFGSSDPGEPILDFAEAIEAADFYNRLVSIAHPGSKGWDWDGLGTAFAAGRWRWRVNWHESRRATRTRTSRARWRRALPRGPSAARTCTAARASGSTPRPPEREQKAAWLFVNWATSKETQLANLKSEVGGGTRRATPSTSSQRSRRRASRPRRCRTSSPPTRCSTLEAREHPPAPEDRRLERVRHGDLHPALEDAGRPAGPRRCMAQLQRGLREGHRQRTTH